MSLFDQLVDQALSQQSELSPLRAVVEKELLHHDILRLLSHHNFLSELTFIGGTCLRTCYGAVRLSEDLDFTGGKNFTKESLSKMGDVVTSSLRKKYDLDVEVSEPVKEAGNTDTWKIKILTKPEQKNMPEQRIHIDICALRSYDRKPAMLLNPYGVDMGTGGLIVQAQSLEEIYLDKLVAFALRPNRIKNRDLWDILWLHQQNIKPALNFLKAKLADRNCRAADFYQLYLTRSLSLTDDKKIKSDFQKEMLRFLPINKLDILKQEGFWDFLAQLLEGFEKDLANALDT